jgi:peptidyl-prolyl cis-trans isomerase B (cyclophilin B)
LVDPERRRIPPAVLAAAHATTRKPRRIPLKNLFRCLSLLLLGSMALTFAGPQEAAQPETQPAAEEPAKAPETLAILHTSLGDITLAFYPETAPKHVENFLDLSRSKFYDGTLFHRVISGFMIQGGDPLSKDDNPRNDGTGNGPRRLKAEFSSRPHNRGALSMARGQNPDSASCQFFIVHQDSNFLDGKYSVFGHVIDGLDVVDKIAAGQTDPRDRPLKDVVIESVEVTTR